VRAYTAFRDAFVAKLDSDGGLVWNTFLGGGGNDEGLNLAADGNGNTYVTGYSMTTWENPIRPFTSNEDAFAAKLGASGNLLWSTFLGGERSDMAGGIDIDGSGNTYVAGYSTAGWGNPIRAYTAGIDAFAVKIDPNGGLTWNTFLGSSTTDYAYNIDVDRTGSAYVIGHGIATWGNPVRPYTGEMDAFVVKLGSPPLVVSTSLKPTMNPGPGSFTVTFNKDVSNPPGSSTIDDATNPNNYLLIDKGTNGIVDTQACTSGRAADDEQVTVTGAAYSSTTFTSTITLRGALPAGKYRLFVCGTTSIVDLANNALAGNGITSGTDYIFDFTVNTGTTSSSTGTSLPETGFAPGVVTSLPSQAADKAYASLGDLWLEIPSQGIKTSIVGVPQSDQDWDVTWLGDNIGWLHGTAFPTWGGNSVLTGHAFNANGLPGPFANIKNLNYDDRLIVHLSGERYIFEVQSTRLSRPTSTGFVFEHLEGYSYLTLITCQVYNPISDSYLFRRIVRAVLVEVEAE
jgi:LPXTG-site transpeptidase (sortase) family protein